jgi:hypothetical protein
MKKNLNTKDCVCYFRKAYRYQGFTNRPYDKLSCGTLDNWFTTSGDLKCHVPKMVKCSFFGFIMEDHIMKIFDCLWFLPLLRHYVIYF